MSKLLIARQIPFNILLKRVIKKIFSFQKIDYTHRDHRKTESPFKINSLIDNVELEGINCEEHFLKHEFDLLGSGWVNRNINSSKEQLEIHQQTTKKIRSLISTNYQLINWQLDIRKGFEFDITKQYNNQKIEKGVDIKNCWELGRLQHLPPMAIAGLNSDKKEQLITEFKDQCLDFIASNPVGMGVQWACAMDVGIRVANLLVACDIFNEMDETNVLNDEFKQIFADSVYQHGLFIYNHLEDKEGAAGNHYLFNLVGLLFVTNYLSSSSELNRWKAFAEEELATEFYKQFFEDGGNFEGSTTYHCLSAEAIVYGTALMMRDDKQISPKYIDLLYKVGNFVLNVSKPNGEMPQFGDNDSGRLFKFVNRQNLLNYESLLAAFSGIFEGNDFDYFSKQYQNQKAITEQIARNKKLRSKPIEQIPNTNYQIPNSPNLISTKIDFSSSIVTEKIKHFIYPDFGISIFKSDQFYLAISTIANKKMHHSWGHVHNDKLSFELQVNGEDMIKDSGTYTYSADSNLRNEFRSVKAHHGIVIENVEQNRFVAPFYMDREVECKILEIQDLSITLQANYYGVDHIRQFEITENQLIITDQCNMDFEVNINQFDKYSPNYGVVQITKQ